MNNETQLQKQEQSDQHKSHRIIRTLTPRTNANNRQQLTERNNTTTMILEAAHTYNSLIGLEFFVSLIATIFICLRYSCIGSTSIPIWTMAGAPSTTADNGDFTVNNGHSGYALVNVATVQQSTMVRHTLTMMGQLPQVPHRHLQSRSQWRLRSKMQLQLLK
eukprot:2336859-Amphidinium_carterae.4